MSERTAEKTASLADVVTALDDLTRVYLATQGGLSTRSEAVRKLSSMGLRNHRIARILDMKASDVASVVAKANRMPHVTTKGMAHAAE